MRVAPSVDAGLILCGAAAAGRCADLWFLTKVLYDLFWQSSSFVFFFLMDLLKRCCFLTSFLS